MIDPGASEDTRQAFGPRAVGALAGLVPAALVVLMILVTGTLAARFDSAPAMGAIALGAVVVGWLAGPLVKGSFRPDVFALVVYALLASVLYLLVGSIQGALAVVSGDGRAVDLGLRLERLVGQLAYGLLYGPFWAVSVSPFAFAWVVAVRVLRRRWAPAPARVAPSGWPGDSGRLGAVRPRRMVLIAAGVIVVYGLFVTLLPFALYDEVRPPWWYQRPVVLFGLFAMPALVAAIGAIRGVRPLVVAAGVLALLQSYVAFSGVTIGFVIPALVLLALGSSGSWPGVGRASRSAILAGVVVIGLTIGAWASLLALTEPRCWTYSIGPDGTTTSVEVAVGDRITVVDGVTYGEGSVSGSGSGTTVGSGEGCGSAEPTMQGIGVSAVLAVGAVAIAVGTARLPRRTDPA